jgi:hypothetical protein
VEENLARIEQMTIAWVITRGEHPDRRVEVIGIVSARKSAQRIKEYLEWLYALLHYNPCEHLAFSRYNNPTVFYKAQVGRDMVWCDDMIAELGRKISLIESCGNQPFLQWTIRNDVIRKAPVHLPLRIMSEDAAPMVAAEKDTEALKPPSDLEQQIMAAVKEVGLEQLVLESIKLRQEEMVEECPPCSEPNSTV